MQVGQVQEIKSSGPKALAILTMLVCWKRRTKLPSASPQLAKNPHYAHNRMVMSASPAISSIIAIPPQVFYKIPRMNAAWIATVLAVSAMVTNGVGQSAATPVSPCGSETAESRLKDTPKAMAFFEKLRAAVDRDDRDAVAEMVQFPLRVNGKFRIATRKEFLRVYDRVFDTKVREAIKRQRTECIFGNWQGFMAGRGDVWFEYTPKDQNFKVIAVNNDRWPAGAIDN
jgi:hypothetical protein